MDTSSTNRTPVRFAIVAALERELAPLVKDWKRVTVSELRVYESGGSVATAGGIGRERAAAAAKVLVDKYSPKVLISAGLAGALDSRVSLGDAVFASKVIDATTGRSWPAASGSTVLVTSSALASVADKRTLAARYQAQAVDMEAAAVAEVAAQKGITFMAAKAISDAADFELPGLGRFIRGGRFRTASFAAYSAIRPWLWPRVWQLARNSERAIQALTHLLKQLISGEAQALSAVKSEQGSRSK